MKKKLVGHALTLTAWMLNLLFLPVTILFVPGIWLALAIFGALFIEPGDLGKVTWSITKLPGMIFNDSDWVKCLRERIGEE